MAPWYEANRGKAAGQKAMRAEKRQDRETREKQKGLPQLHKEAREAVHEYIRLRDAHLPCISCGALPRTCRACTLGVMPALPQRGKRPQHRYNPMNINAQCVHCNQHLAGNPIGYRSNLANTARPKRWRLRLTTPRTSGAGKKSGASGTITGPRSNNSSGRLPP